VKISSLVGAALGAGAATVAAGLLEAYAFRVVRHELTLPDQPTQGRVRLLHISDLHYTRGQRAKARFVASLAELSPDIVVATGDLLADDDGFDEFSRLLAPLLELPGVFVFGSNDYFGPSPVNPVYYLRHPSGRARTKGPVLAWRRVRDFLADGGWTDLNNARTRLQAAGLTLEIRGAGDAHISMDDYLGGAATASADWADQPADLLIGVTHAPYRRVLDAMTADGVPLMLAGHTHGGQICLPGKALVANCDLPTSMIRGVHRYPPEGDQSWLHVTAGVGTAPTFPLRTFCRPEACLLEVILS